MYAMSGNISAAQASYEAAIELEPLSSPLRYWYGGFLMRYSNDLDGAKAQFAEALRLATIVDPENWTTE
jgi:Tfp pilus assembly protein PilF